MALRRDAFSGDRDRAEMQSLAKACSAENLHVLDLPYRLSSWALDVPANGALWRDASGRLIAWAVMQTPFWAVDIVCSPEHEARLYPEVLAWASERAAVLVESPYGRPAWFVMAFANQTERIRRLEGEGFQCQANVDDDAWSKVLMRQAGPEAVRLYEPPPGFEVRPLRGEGEVARYVELHQAVFESKNMTVGWRIATLKQPGYRPELDLVVAAPDGRLAAFCVCWWDTASGRGQIEPLGCHADFRRYALGRVALAQGLQRLQALGAKEIFVETDNYRNTTFRLYESFGFEIVQQVLVFRKDYAAAR